MLQLWQTRFTDWTSLLRPDPIPSRLPPPRTSLRSSSPAPDYPSRPRAQPARPRATRASLLTSAAASWRRLPCPRAQRCRCCWTRSTTVSSSSQTSLRASLGPPSPGVVRSPHLVAIRCVGPPLTYPRPCTRRLQGISPGRPRAVPPRARAGLLRHQDVRAESNEGGGLWTQLCQVQREGTPVP